MCWVYLCINCCNIVTFDILDFDAENFYVVNKSEIEKEVGCDLYDSEGNLQVKGPKTLKHKTR